MPFREDSDFAFQVLARGGEIRWRPDAEVVHPPVPRGWTSALKLARRYEMDALLRRRFPRRYPRLDTRAGLSHLRQVLYLFMFLASLSLLFSARDHRHGACGSTGGSASWRSASASSMIGLSGLATTLMISSAASGTLRTWRHLPACGFYLPC